MIPVKLQPEPDDFDQTVRKPGQKWLKENHISFDRPPPDPSALPPYWRSALKDLWGSYRGICAYLCIYFDWALGAQSTDHFVAKSRHAGLAYNWDNYRLCCLGMNRRKNRFDDLLDPFEIDPDTFILDLVSGDMRPNPTFPDEIRTKANNTIKRLGLNDPDNKKMRTQRYQNYLDGHTPEPFFKMHSPFVWYEAHRQNLL